MSDGHQPYGEVVGDILRPQIKPMPRWDDPVDSAGGQVVSERAAWEARAAAAEQAAQQLQQAAYAVQHVLANNYFGEGCEEGKDLYDRLTKALHGPGGLRAQWVDQAVAARDLAAQCRNAGAKLGEVDDEHGRAIGGR